MNKKANLLIIFLFICKLLFAIQDQDDLHKTISLSPDINFVAINTSVYCFEDTEDSLSFEDIIKPEFSGNFKLTPVENMNFGYTNSTYWVRFHLQNLHPQVDDYLLEINNHNLDTIDFFYLNKEDRWEHMPLGDMYPFQQRELPFRTFVIPLQLPDSSEITYYARIKGIGVMLFPMIISRENSFHKMSLLSEIYYGILFGIMFLLIIINIFIYFSIRDISYLYYSILILSTTVFIAFTSGHLFQYVLKNSMFVNNRLLPSIIVLCAFSMINFTRSFLNIKKSHAKLHRILLFLMIFELILIVLLFFPKYAISIKTSTYTAQLSILLSLFCGILSLLKGNRAARLFILAFLALLLGGIAISLIVVGVYGHNFLSEHGMELGQLANGIILSLALVNNYRIDKLEKEKAQEEILRMRQKANEILEQTVKDRTIEISEKNKELLLQKEEVETQRDEIEAQRDEIEAQRDLVVEQKQAITDSITYAKRIQSAVLPTQEYMDAVLPEYFVLFKPRDIVSGDFYWIKEVKNYLIIVAADCTGHGVPGAFMSMLGITLLNEQFGRSQFDKPGEILSSLRKKVKETLTQAGKIQEQKDGMDMALVIIDNESKELQYAGANNPLYLIRDKNQVSGDQLEQYTSLDNNDYQLFEVKGDRQPISIYSIETDFTTKQIQLQVGDSIYLFSDGFVDQKGGPNRKKFLSKNFKKCLLEIQSVNMEEQHKILNDTLEKWRKGYEQIDDILVMGFRV